MPKLKTNRSVKKRIRISKKGKARRFRPCKRHLLTGKKAKRKRLLSRPALVSKGEQRMIKKILPYGA
jgi:large subunit ribosomal protein L35